MPCVQRKNSRSQTAGTKVPVFTDEDGEVVVDSTPIMNYIDEKYNKKSLSEKSGTERYDSMLAHVDEAWKRATIPILYGSLGSALSTTRRVSKLEKFGFISRRLYAGRVPDHVGDYCSETGQEGWENAKETLARLVNRLHEFI